MALFENDTKRERIGGYLAIVTLTFLLFEVSVMLVLKLVYGIHPGMH